MWFGSKDLTTLLRLFGWIIDDTSTAIYGNWFHDYSLDTLKCALAAAKFNIRHVWNDLTGSGFNADGDWIAVAAQKVF